MNHQHLSVRNLEQKDLESLVRYWTQSEAGYMQDMGVDVEKLPTRDEWIIMLKEQINLPYSEKKSYCTIWELYGEPIGHCNVNKIVFAEQAYMHLHIWNPVHRQAGLGPQFVQMSLPCFFNNLNLKTLYCEPYALNSAPNKTLPKLGFRFLKSYTCVPGFICFEQQVNLWELSLENYRANSILNSGA